jgi:hypothetical protein
VVEHPDTAQLYDPRRAFEFANPTLALHATSLPDVARRRLVNVVPST